MDMYIKFQILKIMFTSLFFISNLSAINAVKAQESDDNPVASINWVKGPAKVTIADKATLFVPKGYGFLGIDDTDKFLEYTKNIPTGKDFTLMRFNKDNYWWALFSFDSIGYVKDNEKIDADSILNNIKSGTEQANEESKKRGWPTMSVVGWSFDPQYDKSTNLLEWAIIGKNDTTGSVSVNYNTRILGRKGVMEVVLIDKPESLEESVTAFKSILQQFEFLPGQKYAEYKQGDKIAEYGLAALIAGGTAAAVAKSGFGKAIWKFIVVGIAALFAGVKSLFKRKA